MESGVIIANVVGWIDPHTARLAIRPMKYLAAAQGEGGVSSAAQMLGMLKIQIAILGMGLAWGT